MLLDPDTCRITDFSLGSSDIGGGVMPDVSISVAAGVVTVDGVCSCGVNFSSSWLVGVSVAAGSSITVCCSTIVSGTMAGIAGSGLFGASLTGSGATFGTGSAACCGASGKAGTRTSSAESKINLGNPLRLPLAKCTWKICVVFTRSWIIGGMSYGFGSGM